jgi:hypothetical protein
MRQLIDDFMPEWDWGERHSRVVHAPPARVDSLLRALTPRDLPLARLLLGARLLFSPIRQDPDATFIDAMKGLGFAVLADVPREELVMGIGGQFWRARADSLDPIAGPEEWNAYDRPNAVRVALNFALRPEGAGSSLLSLETRIQATDARARRTFGLYWRLIMPGSALIRRETLWVMARRAQP